MDAARKDYARLAKALRSFADEHGLPNAVSPSELYRDHNGPPALKIGRLLRQSWVRTELVADIHIRVTDVAAKHPQTGLTQIQMEDAP